MKKKVSKIIFLAIVLFVLCKSILCMDQSNKKDVGVFLSKEGKALFILLQEKIDLIDHKMICALAINKECNRILLNTAPMRRAYLKKSKGRRFWWDLPVWHKYGSAYIQKHIQCTSSQEVQHCFYIVRHGEPSYSPTVLYDCEKQLDFLVPTFASTGDIHWVTVRYNKTIALDFLPEKATKGIMSRRCKKKRIN